LKNDLSKPHSVDDENFQPVRLQPPPQDILPVRLHGLEKSLPLYLHLLKAPALMAPQLPNIEPQIVMTGKTYQRRNRMVVPQESGNKRG